MPPPPKKGLANFMVTWDQVFVGILFTPQGLKLNVTRPLPPDFRDQITAAEKAVAKARAKALALTPPGRREGGEMSSRDLVRYDGSVEVPLFQGHTIEVSSDRVTEFYFYSESPYWKFVPPGFETHDPVYADRFQGTEIVNDDYAVRTCFMPNGVEGEWFKYNLWMKTRVYDNSGNEKGHVIIIIDPVVETKGVRQ
jgi:hypothetical protein